MVNRHINNKETSTKGFEDLYPFEGKFLDIQGHQLHYLDQGKGSPVLMVHGNPTWSFYYRNMVKDLSKTHRTIVPDHMGCGFSDKPGTTEYDYTLENRVSDLDRLIRHLDLSEKISLIVHDWGGMIGLAWALDNLDRIDKIVITNTSGFFLPKDKKLPLALGMIKYLKYFAVPAVLGANIFCVAALYIGSKTPLSPKVKKGLTAPYNSWKNRIATLKFVQDIPITDKDRSFGIVDRVDKNLHRLDPDKLLFLWGTQDFVFDIHFLNEFRHRRNRGKDH